MLIATAGSSNYPYHITIDYCRSKAEEYGYKFAVYDLGGLGFGIGVDDLRCESKYRTVRCGLKPELILDALENTEEQTVAWIDGDAILVQPIDEIDEDESFDVAITVRPKRNRKKTSYINAGVIFVKNNERGREFVREWVRLMPFPPAVNVKKKPTYYCDQVFLENQLLLPNIDVIPWDAFGTVHKVHGARVKLLDCERYNNFWIVVSPERPPSKDTKIIHFKDHRMQDLSNYKKKFLDV